MVAKGHHFEGVALAAVVDADTGMALPDFRAEERTFQLVTQLAGRSGRDAPGRVLVQTYQPDSRPISLAARHAVDEFLAGEIDRRRELGYPPFRHLVRIVVSGPGVNGPSALLTELRAGLEGADGDLLGPAPLLRLRNRSRAQLLVKTANPRPVASRAARLLAAAAPAMRRESLTASVDVDPQGLAEFPRVSPGNHGRMGLGEIIGLIIVGLIVGALGRLFHPGVDSMGILMTMAIGIASALLVGWLVGGGILGFILAVIVAVVLVALWSRMVGPRTATNRI